MGEDYLRYMDEVFAFDEKVSRDLLGREVRQVLLLHANALNADYFDRLAAGLVRREYRFVTLQDALRDEAYRRPLPPILRPGSPPPTRRSRARDASW